MADRFYDGMPGPEIRQELNHAYEFMTGAMVSPTSSTTLTVGTGEQILTVEENKALGIGQAVRIARTSDPLTWMDGVVTSYVGTTLKVLVSDTDGSGTYSDWTVTLSGAAGPQGDEGPQGPAGPAGPPNSLSIGTVQGGASAGATITGNAPTQTLNLTLPKGDAGDDGWSPILVLEFDGDRRVLKIDDWTGGDGTKPGTGYIGSTGIVQDKANAVDVRGATGSTGATGPANSLSIGTVQGGASAGATITGAAPTQTLNLTLPKGDAGDDGWAPMLAIEADNDRRVLKVTDWTGGDGTKPGTGYVGASGLVQDKANGIDIRGEPGSGAVSSVNSVGPDGSGDVDLDTDDIPEGSTNKYFIPYTAGTKNELDAGTENAVRVYAPDVLAAWLAGKNYVSTDTTYAAGTKAELDTGSETGTRVYAPKTLSDWLAGKGYTGNTGTVTSVGMSVPTGLKVANSPVTTSGTLTVTFDSGYSLPTTAKQGNWDTAYGWGNHAGAGYASDSAVLKKADNLSDLNNAATARGNLGGTTVGQNLFTLPNPGAIRFLRLNANNTVTLRTPAQFREDIGASGTEPVNADWNAASGLAQILNKPAIPTLAPIAGTAGIASLSGGDTVTPGSLGTAAAAAGVISGGSSPSFNWSAAVNYTMALTGNRTLPNPTNVLPGSTRVIVVSSSTSTSRTLAFGSNFVGDLPTVAVTNTSNMVLFLYAVSATKIVVSGVEI